MKGVRMRRIVGVLAVIVCLSLARTIRVPSEQPTIQAGLNAANSRDTVLVAPGSFKENIIWPSQDGIKLISEQGRDSTVIDGNNAGICVKFSSGSISRATVIRGFTITKGNSTGPSGIECRNSSPSILENRITRCYGGGVYLTSYNSGWNPLLKGNEIDGNVKETDRNYGGGVHIDCSNSAARPEICFNHIHHDTLRNGAWNYGGGIFCDANALIYQNVIEANVLTSDTGTSCRAYGGGIFVDMNQAPVIFSNLIINNRCVTDAWKYGAGIRLYLGAKGFIVNNTIAGNYCASHMWSNGGGIYNDMRCTTYVKNNIITGNQASSGSAIYNYTTTQNGQVISSYNDYYNNSLSGCSMGTGDITGNPLFVSGWSRDYFLSQTAAGQPSNSPCVDAGDTLDMKVPLSLDSLVHAWTTRTDSVCDMDETDMGYHYPAGIPVGLVEQRIATHPALIQAIVFPDPFRTGVTVRYRLPEAGPVDIRIFDAAGREIATVLEANQIAGEHRVELKPGLNPGVYFVVVEAAGRCTRLRCTAVD